MAKLKLSPWNIDNNIWSGSKDSLLAALTNPTELAKKKGNLKHSYPVTDKTGKVWADSEAAYQAFKSTDRNNDYDEKVMVKIITAKLLQYPNLINAVTRNGGVVFLESCSHIVVGNERWEGIGTSSRFIRCLIAAYLKAIKVDIPY